MDLKYAYNCDFEAVEIKNDQPRFKLCAGNDLTAYDEDGEIRNAQDSSSENLRMAQWYKIEHGSSIDITFRP